MRLGADRVAVRVPATSGNLGPGFDCLGLALGIYDKVAVRLIAADRTSITVRGEGAGVVEEGADHLVARALRRTLEAVGAPLTGLEMACTNAIPHGRGLGSSASAAVAGIVAARALLAHPQVLTHDDVLALATEFEGHPDNAAPAIVGGATIAWFAADGAPHAVQLEIDPSIRATVVIPSAELPTKIARAVLPSEVPFFDAAFNLGRAALLVEALTTRPELLLEATADRLHQPYRSSAMASSAELLRALREAGFAATVSGAGPSVLVLHLESLHGSLVALLDELIANLDGWRVVHPEIDRVGAAVRRL